MIQQIKRAFQYWGVLPSIGFILIIISQLMIIGGTIWELCKW
ncbi:hypothetical protein VAH1_00192 [Escherichia phage vB_EcoS_VAH1]|uniref:Uncharacterized protein n=2 Tax=Tequintavirus TaxID=187218 RepID=A0A482N5Q9_9CAUD|nr:hypothetical protein VAH1_00192 [Escherichia phage vB_EcoS_VAH1]